MLSVSPPTRYTELELYTMLEILKSSLKNHREAINYQIMLQPKKRLRDE